MSADPIRARLEMVHEYGYPMEDSGRMQDALRAVLDCTRELRPDSPEAAVIADYIERVIAEHLGVTDV